MATPVHELAGGEEVLGLDPVSGILRPLIGQKRATWVAPPQATLLLDTGAPRASGHHPP